MFVSGLDSKNSQRDLFPAKWNFFDIVTSTYTFSKKAYCLNDTDGRVHTLVFKSFHIFRVTPYSMF